MSPYRLGFLGAGNMAEAIARGALRAGLLTPDRLLAADPAPDRRDLFRRDLRAAVLDNNSDLVRRADVILLAVKPQQADQVMSAIGPFLTADKLLISIAAGVRLARLARFCPSATRIIRTMPNTPMLVGRGMVALCRGPRATDADVRLARDLFASAARVLEVPEEKMDAVTAVSGSGPAYFFYLVEALTDAAVELGLSRAEATVLAETTFAGAAELLAAYAAPAPADAASRAPDLRRRVTSPGGTTAAAIAALDADQFRDIIAHAVRAARDRSRELGH